MMTTLMLLPRYSFILLLLTFQLLVLRPSIHDTTSEWNTNSVCLAQGLELEETTQEASISEQVAIAEDEASDPRLLQQNTNSNKNNNVCTHEPSLSATSSSSNRVISQVLNYLDQHQSIIEDTILQSYTDYHENVTVPSTQYKYQDFRDSLEWMARTGVPRPNRLGGGKWKFYLGPDNCDDDGWHVGLGNVAAFLSQSMTMVILNDTCDELNWEPIFPNPFAEVPKWYYPLSNACGQRGVSYTSSSMHTCPLGEEMYQCEVDPSMRIKAASKSTFGGYTPPELQCYPRTAAKTYTGHFDPAPERGPPRVRNEEGNVIPSKAGRTDVESCCYWGRGALHTGGICNIGKLNFALGSGRRTNRYSDIDFCKNPEATCSDETRTMEMRWIVALFEWADRVQSYDNNDMGWNYMEELTKFMSGDFISSVEFSMKQGEPSHFIDQVGGILEQGCPFPPCDTTTPNRLRWKSQRKNNFVTAIKGVGLPVKSELFSEMEEHFTGQVKEKFEDIMLLSRSPVDGKMYQSYRYHFNDFIESLRKMSDVGFEGSYFYIGQGEQGSAISDSNAGLLNIALFLSYAIEMSILDDACDEHNTQLINGRYPVSNACGQYGANYQDIVCEEEDAGKECPLDPNQSFSAVTRTLDHRAPQPFKCAPKSQYPVTGFWDEAHLEENHKTAFTNQIGRVDIEGCCWWGRGVLRQVAHGRCFFGQMNHYIGKKAASDGRPSLFPHTDFCQFPEAVCANEHSNELRWISGMFFWMKRVQQFNKDGWNFLDKLKELSTYISMTGEIDVDQLMPFDCILKTNSVECDDPEDISNRLNDVLNLVTTFKLPTQSPTWTTSPSSSPTNFPTVTPTDEPTFSPTSTLAPSAAPNIYWYPSRTDVTAMIQVVEARQKEIEENLLTPRVDIDDVDLYSFRDFLSALQVFAEGSVQGIYFYVGHEDQIKRRRGLVNVAAFLAHSKTAAIYNSVCDEQNVDGIQGKFPLSNSCGQFGAIYQNLRCPPDEWFMECPPDPGMQMTAVAPLTSSDSLADDDGSPAFFCGPRRYFPFTGYYDDESNTIRNGEPFANRAGRTDVEGCCWWGRGVGQVKGTCMYGKLNYYIGARAAAEGRRSLFPSVDFCQNPQSICSGPDSYSLMWMTGMFSWIDQIQSHPEYSDNLIAFVDRDIKNDKFIDLVSDIVGSSEADRIARRANFQLALKALRYN